MHVKNLFIGAALAIAALGAGPTQADTLRVAAAANLQQVFTDAIIPAFEQATGSTVTPTFGSTKQLATQLAQGAPDDVFVAADTATVNGLVKQGLLDGKSDRVYAIGQLVMWTRADAPLHPRHVEDLADPRYLLIAIANPALAPYGAAAEQAIDHAGIASELEGRIVQAENIGQSLQFARSGNADVSFTALSLVIKDKTDPYVIVPDSYHSPIAQSAAVVTSTSEAALASSFMAFITGPQAAPIWKLYGYELPK